MLAIDLVISPPPLTAARAGSRIPISSAMRPMTTSSPVMVKPRRGVGAGAKGAGAALGGGGPGHGDGLAVEGALFGQRLGRFGCVLAVPSDGEVGTDQQQAHIELL